MASLNIYVLLDREKTCSCLGAMAPWVVYCPWRQAKKRPNAVIQEDRLLTDISPFSMVCQAFSDPVGTSNQNTRRQFERIAKVLG